MLKGGPVLDLPSVLLAESVQLPGSSLLAQVQADSLSVFRNQMSLSEVVLRKVTVAGTLQADRR